MAPRSTCSITQPLVRFNLLLALMVCAGSCGTQIARANEKGPIDPQTVQTSCDPVTAQTLDVATTINKVLAGQQCHLYKFDLPANVYAHAVVEQKGVDIKLTVFALEADKQVSIAEIDRPSGSRGPESVSWITNAKATYLLRVRPLQADAPSGSYTLRLDQPRAPQLLDETRIKAERASSAGEKARAEADNENAADEIRRKRFGEAIDSFQSALADWQALKEPYEQAVALYGLGMSYSGLGSLGMVKFPLPSFRLRWNYQAREHHQHSIQCFQQAIDLMKSLRDQYGQAVNYAGMAWPNLYLGKQKESLQNSSTAFDLFKAVDDPKGEGIALYGIGWVHALANENQTALKFFLDSLARRSDANDTSGLAITKASIARLNTRLGKYSEALDYCDQALQLFRGRRHGTASTLSVKAWTLYAMKDLKGARTNFETVRTLRHDLNDTTGEANALYGIARVDDVEGQLNKALAQMKQVVDMVEQLRGEGTSDDLRTYYFANVQEYYRFYVDLLMRAGDQAGALAINERARARELLATLAETEENAQDVDRSWVAPLQASEIRQLLDEQTVLLELALGESRSYVWLVSRDDVHGYPLPDGPTLEAKARQVYELLTARNHRKPGETETRRKLRIQGADREFVRQAGELSQMLFGPLATKLEGKRLAIVSEGALQLLPFSALPVPTTNGGPQSRDYEPLVAGHEIVNLPSASILGALRHLAASRKPPPKTVAVLGDPVFSRDDPRVSSLKTQASRRDSRRANDILLRPNPNSRDNSLEYLQRLSGTRWEAQQIVSLVSPTESLLALDFAANRNTVLNHQLAQFRIIHFATHALINESDPALSEIVLSRVDERGNLQNGSLTMADIYQLALPVELVVLSACRTGLGKDVVGEGLVGMTSSFMHAGTPRIIVSLWPIKDDVAAEFMVSFYQKMLGQTSLSSAAALREAQLKMMKDTRSRAPYFWACFIQQGEWK